MLHAEHTSSVGTFVVSMQFRIRTHCLPNNVPWSWVHCTKLCYYHFIKKLNIWVIKYRHYCQDRWSKTVEIIKHKQINKKIDYGNFLISSSTVFFYRNFMQTAQRISQISVSMDIKFLNILIKPHHMIFICIFMCVFLHILGWVRLIKD